MEERYVKTVDVDTTFHKKLTEVYSEVYREMLEATTYTSCFSSRSDHYKRIFVIHLSVLKKEEARLQEQKRSLSSRLRMSKGLSSTEVEELKGSIRVLDYKLSEVVRDRKEVITRLAIEKRLKLARDKKDKLAVETDLERIWHGIPRNS